LDCGPRLGTPYELPALVVRARAADQAATASGPNRSEKLRAAAVLYERLVKLLGDSSATLGSNKNALAASSKLAQYDEELERWPAAADRLGRLVAAQPETSVCSGGRESLVFRPIGLRRLSTIGARCLPV